MSYSGDKGDKIFPRNSRLENFYTSLLLPVHVRNLLSVYGIEEVEQLTTFGDGEVKCIEESVRAGTFGEGFIIYSALRFLTWRSLASEWAL